MLTAFDIASLIAKGRFDLSTEGAAQDDMQSYLAARLPLDCSLSREHRLCAADRPDFLINESIVVEVKARGGAPGATLRQLERYAAHDAVDALILATGKAMALPDRVGGKPLFVVNLGRAWL